MKLRIGTRGSDLALWQANYVAAKLRAEGVLVEICVLETRGDRIDDVPLQNVEGKAFFTAEIEQALYEKRVDLAVHSHKDLPTESPAGLLIAAVPLRAEQNERLLLQPACQARGMAFLPLARGARIGTSSPRRRAQIEALRPDLEVLDLRGNVPTRVQRLREGRYDAILLAAAGLSRLQLDTSDMIALDLPMGLFVPAPAQGALALQTRADDLELRKLCLRVFHHEPTNAAIVAERSLLRLAGGGCNLALGAALQQEGAAWRASVFRGPDATDPERKPSWTNALHADPGRAAQLALEAAESTQASGVGPLGGLRVEVVGSRSAGSQVGERLAQLGALVAHQVAIAYESIECPGFAERLSRLVAGDALAVTSARAAEVLRGLELPQGVLLAAVGAATARALVQVGQVPDLVGSSGARELGGLLQLKPNARVLFPCAEGALFELEEGLQGRAVHVERIEVYRTLALPGIELDASADVRIYMSPSAVRASASWEHLHPAQGTERAALGYSTAGALALLKLAGFVPSADAPDPIEALVGHLATRRPRSKAQL